MNTTTFPYLHPSDIMVNRYAGPARCCGVHVDADEGKAEQARRAEAQAARDAGFAAQDVEWAKQGLVRCDHCGGAGHSEAWRSTGYTCFGCGGTGTKREGK